VGSEPPEGGREDDGEEKRRLLSQSSSSSFGFFFISLNYAAAKKKTRRRRSDGGGSQFSSPWPAAVVVVSKPEPIYLFAPRSRLEPPLLRSSQEPKRANLFFGPIKSCGDEGGGRRINEPARPRDAAAASYFTGGRRVGGVYPKKSKWHRGR